MSPRTAMLVLVALAAFGVGAWYALGPGVTSPSGGEPAGAGYVLDEPRPLPKFELVDEQGRAFTRDDFMGHWSVLYFGFTYCPDVCPSALSVMAQVNSHLEAAGDVDDRYYLVSVDPERDTPDRLAEYVTYFDPAFRGLTGDFDQLDRITRAAGAVYRLPEDREGGNYLVAHSSTLTVIDPEGRVHAIFTAPFEPEAIAADLERMTGG